MDPTQTLTGILDDGISIFGTAGINAGLSQVNSAPGFPYGYYSPYPPGYAVTPSGGSLTPSNAPLSAGVWLLIIVVVFWFVTRKKG